MLSGMRSRPNHYEMLGLTPAASDTQINEAFAKKISLFGANPAGAAAQVCIAYETLRNPARRRDYDLLLGITPPPQPHPSQLTIAMTSQRWAPLIGAAVTEPALQPAGAPERQVTTAETQARHPKAPSQSFVAATGPLKEEDYQRLEEQLRGRLRAPDRKILSPAHSSRIGRPPADQRTSHGEPYSTGFNRTGLIIGGIVLAVIVLGAWAGSVAGNDVETSEAQQTADRTHPPQKPLRQGHAASEGVPGMALHIPLQTRPLRTGARAGQHSRVRQRHGPKTGQSSLSPAPDPSSDGAQSPVDKGVLPEPATPAEGALPLPNSVIARTISRIGYRCGEVASASAVGSGPGVFRISCTSGDSYQATPVQGRYRFRHLGRS